MGEQYWLGVDLGGTKTLAGLFDDSFKLVGRAKEATPREGGPAAVIRVIESAVIKALDEAKVPIHKVRGMGMGVPGQVDPVAHHVKYAPNLNWRDVDLPALLPKAWGWPTVIENDVRIGTYGEWKHGAAKGAKHVLGVFAGTGVGGGLILNGQLYQGFNFNAGEIGHVVIHWRKGTELESIAGRRALFKRAAQWIEDAPKRDRKAWKGIDLENAKSSLLADLYEKSDPIARQLIDDAAKALGTVIGSVLNLLSPEVVVLGGGMAGALGDSFLERVWEIACRYALPGAADGVRCVPAALEDDSGIYGAAAYARDQAK
jgi:glucokinase